MAKKQVRVREIYSELRPYEIMILLNPELLQSAVQKKLSEITSLIKEAGGRITEEDFWGKRELAYKIKGNKEGIYMVYNAEVPQTFLKEFNEALRIEKDVLRHLVVSIPKDYVYTRYDLETPSEAPKEKSRRHQVKKNVSIKHNAPVSSDEKKIEKEDKNNGEEPKRLDEKLDSILDGGDLNL